MGQLVNGKWVTTPPPQATNRAFRRAEPKFRNWITPDGQAGPSGRGGFPAASGRYHLYVSYACPWAHRTLIYRALKSLEDHISFSVVHPDALEDGWTFEKGFDGTTGDRILGKAALREIYTAADPHATCRVTVPVLWDIQTGTIVSNESSEIIRMFNSAFDGVTGNTTDYYPSGLRREIDAVNARIYDTMNNGVYKCGFAASQPRYDTAVQALFETLDWLEEQLTSQRYLIGDRVTEADWRLLPTLLRFDPVYFGHFKCNRNRLSEFPNLWGYTRELYQWPGIAATTRQDHYLRHYYYSHESINPHRIVPINPAIDYSAPHGRVAV